MGDNSASAPAKAGSKLASMQALGRRGGIREGQGESSEAPPEAKAGKPGKASREGKSSPAKKPRFDVGAQVKKLGADSLLPVKAPSKKRVTKTKVKTVKRARAVLKKAETAAKAKAKKPGPPAQIGQPWKAAGVSKATYYRNLKQDAVK